jgi:hypothetical protein
MSKGGGQAASFVVAGEAYAKMVMHINKYPHLAVNGVLLGSSSAKPAIRVVDYVPLFHGAILAPMLEAALMLVRSIVPPPSLPLCRPPHTNPLSSLASLSHHFMLACALPAGGRACCRAAAEHRCVHLPPTPTPPYTTRSFDGCVCSRTPGAYAEARRC